MAVKYDEDEQPEVQLTSMMDCIFLMLIFFLVSSQRPETSVACRIHSATSRDNRSRCVAMREIVSSSRGLVFVLVMNRKLGFILLVKASKAASKSSKASCNVQL
jgi:hypothetical protein